jgi:DNA-binding transcriptional LysR family regulator
MLLMKPTLNLRQVEAFYAVMKAGTTVGAAKLMNVTQPAVSRAIDLLERRIGYKLFERHGRRLVARPEGEMLFRQIEPIYFSLERIAQATQDIRHQRAGAVRIATFPAMSQGLVARAIANFLKGRPEVTAFVQSLPTRQVAELVSTRQFDLGVCELPLSRTGLVVEPLEPARTVVVMPAGHRLSGKRQLSLKDLAAERLVLLSQHGFLRYQIDDAFSSLGIVPRVALETPNSLIACALVAEGAGVTLVSRWTAESFRHPQVVSRPLKEELVSRSALVFPESSARLALTDTLADEVREEARRLGR